MAYLEVTNGSQAGDRYELTATKYVMGRHPDCDIVIDVGAVSRHHAQVLVTDDGIFVEDLHSRNGTFINGQVIEDRKALATGDQIQICDVLLLFLDPSQHPQESPDQAFLGSSNFTPALLVDDEPASAGSTIMSSLDASSYTGLQLGASPDIKLRALLEITQSLGKALSLDDVLPKVLDSLFKIFVQADRGFIVLRSGPDGVLEPRWTKLRRDGDNENLRISRTIINRVMDSKEAILSADAASDSRFEMSQSIANFRIRSMMCAPLVDSEGNAIGALQIDTFDHRSRFQPEDLEVLASVASVAASAIDNAQMHEQALRRQAIERDLELAQTVQKSFLPSKPPQVEGYQFFDFYRAANHVGGDYYDYIELSEGRLALVVADVVGHGIAAALLMAKLAAEVRIALAARSQPAQAVSQLNRRLVDDSMGDRFVTLVLAVLHPHEHELTIVSAGHMAPIVRRSEAELEEVGKEVAGVPLAIDGRFEYEQVTARLESGDVVTMYTDGINEAIGDNGELYGLDRLSRQIAEPADDIGALGRRLIDDVDDFVGHQAQNDDMCLVCFGRT